MEYVYDIFGMSFTLMLSTRPESVSEPFLTYSIPASIIVPLTSRSLRTGNRR